ncbi:MAG: hypothetical protein E4H09_03915 [Spirochaetales bacterium]|nr:MAG: hypothetical protein E4H09_03915 [Spirochaetales bacterium]
MVPTLEMDERVERVLDIDAELPRDYLTPKLMDVVRLFAPFGQQNPPLEFMVRGLTLDEISFMGKEQQHLKLLLGSGKNRWPGVFWNAAAQVNVGFSKGDNVDAIFNLGMNFYNGNESIRLTITDLRRSGDTGSA